MTDPDQLPAPFPPNESGSTQCIVRWMVTLKGGLWLGAYDKEAFDSYALTAIATERARADALEAALSDVLEMAQEHADHFAAAFAGYKPERHAYYARALATARVLLEKT